MRGLRLAAEVDDPCGELAAAWMQKLAVKQLNDELIQHTHIRPGEADMLLQQQEETLYNLYNGRQGKKRRNFSRKN